jgi:carboxypeptidase C (cathepsin A)
MSEHEVSDTNDGKPPEPPPHHEEDSVSSRHSLRIGGEAIRYTATAGRVLLREEDGKKRASFFFTSYIRDEVEDPTTRPVVFAFNGGPGSSSVWLHFGVLGPRRAELDDQGRPVSLPGRTVDNEASLLDAADLVFIDPVGTGFSRGIPKDESKTFHHFTRDVESVAEFIHLYLSRHGRWGSPVFLAGESYGTTRSAALAGHLFDRFGLALNGILLISSILDFATAPFDKRTWTFPPGSDVPYILFLPTYAATAWYHGVVAPRHRDRPLREFLDEVEEFAMSEYALALLRGDRLDTARTADIAERVSEYTGLPVEYITRYRLRIEILRFCKALLRDQERTVGRLDSRFTGIDRFPDGDSMESDPSYDAILGVYTSAANDHIRRALGYQSDLPYEILSNEVHQAWDYEDFKNSQVEVVETLRSTMSRNPLMRVLVANGYYDLATPYFATEHTFSHMGLDPEIRANVDMRYYEAGHMMYIHQASLASLADDLRAFVRSASAG